MSCVNTDDSLVKTQISSRLHVLSNISLMLTFTGPTLISRGFHIGARDIVHFSTGCQAFGFNY